MTVQLEVAHPYGGQNGQLQLDQLDAGVCDTCGHHRPNLASIDLGYPPVLEIAGLALCGYCLAEALAILLGRRHVQGGGSPEDLAQ